MCSVGKTCIIQQFVYKKFSDKYKSTLGADFFTHDHQIKDELYTLQVGVGIDSMNSRSGILLDKSVSRVSDPLSTEERMPAFLLLI